MGTIYKVVVYGLRGEKMVVDLCNTDEQFKKMTVLQLKEKIAERLPETAGLEALRLIFADKMLDGNELLLSDFGIQQQSIIQMVMRVPGGLIA
uniref:Ubiquitin-like domain-containing protein n=1 Tax=Gasterosteus aculeatus aculeatus TaxID=481459 RepID=A0AAQ4PKA7_GASAC